MRKHACPNYKQSNHECFRRGCTREIAPDPELTMYRPNNSNIRSKKTRTRESTKSERDFLKSPDLSHGLKLTDAQCAYTTGWGTRTKMPISNFPYLRALPPARPSPIVDTSSQSPDRCLAFTPKRAEQATMAKTTKEREWSQKGTRVNISAQFGSEDRSPTTNTRFHTTL